MTNTSPDQHPANRQVRRREARHMGATQGILLVRGVPRAVEQCQGVRQAEQAQGGHPAGIQPNTAVETVRLAKRVRVQAMVILDLPMAKELPSTEATTDAPGIMGK